MDCDSSRESLECAHSLNSEALKNTCVEVAPTSFGSRVSTEVSRAAVVILL